MPVPSRQHILRLAGYGNQVPRWEGQTFHQLSRMGTSIAIVALGIDLAKNVFAVHRRGATGNPVPARRGMQRALKQAAARS